MSNQRFIKSSEYSVPNVVLQAQREEVTMVIYALTKLAMHDGAEIDVGNDPELAPLITTIPKATLAALSPVMAYFVAEAQMLLESDETCMSPAGILISFGTKIADIAHRCGLLHVAGEQGNQPQEDEDT